MNRFLLATAALALASGATPAAAAAPAYAVVRVHSTPQRLIIVRFPGQSECRRELSGLQAMVLGELRAPQSRSPEIIPPEAVEGDGGFAPRIDAICRALPAG